MTRPGLETRSHGSNSAPRPARSRDGVAARFDEDTLAATFQKIMEAVSQAGVRGRSMC